jgi:hypothetical protein
LQSLEKAIADILRRAGYKRMQADTEASEKSHQVLAALRRMSPQQLPFEISDSTPFSLIGKQRPRATDSPETRTAREVFDLVPSVRSAVYSLGDQMFERLCTRIMLEEGASESVWNGSPDDGGIDFYGRLPLRSQSPLVPTTLLRTAVITKQLLFLGQSKCFDPQGGNLDRKFVDDFHGSIDICLSQHEGNPDPPSHRVPPTYYRRSEVALGVLCTTAGFSDAARAQSDALDIQLIDGQQIAEFLLATGVVGEDATTADVVSAIAAWSVA